ncbi:MAG TPA: hypothetical protein VJ161_12050 [Geobacteraceae bacterium]|jgi:hypothetical protein|nr:hypothetical protein [Geobacteraceae bacterium]
MVVGFNHNIHYKGESFHVQTEDGGTRNPFITTLLYHGGSIVASKKTGYSDIIKVEMLGKVVEELMQEQHKDMLRRLKAGEFDERAFPGHSSSADSQQLPAQSPSPTAPEPGPELRQSLDEIILDYLASDVNT